MFPFSDSHWFNFQERVVHDAGLVPQLHALDFHLVTSSDSLNNSICKTGFTVHYILTIHFVGSIFGLQILVLSRIPQIHYEML